MNTFEEKRDAEAQKYLDEAFKDIECSSPDFLKLFKEVVDKAFKFGYERGYDYGYCDAETKEDGV